MNITIFFLSSYHKMAFNPNGYQILYGFDMLDELHNFFPEIMYDDQTFSQEHCLWMRHRLRTLFPHVFVRQQNLYTLYQATERRNNFTAWRNTMPAPVASVPSMASVPVIPVLSAIPTVSFTSVPPTINTSPFTPMRTRARNIMPVSPPPAPSRRARHDNPMADIDVATLGLSAIFLDGLLNNNTNNLLFNWMPQQDVPVIPTSAQIDAGTVEVPPADVSEDTTCAVCQEHGTENDVWRKLHCNHYFHSRCILPWFQRNVHCPVCRADIREVPTTD